MSSEPSVTTLPLSAIDAGAEGLASEQREAYERMAFELPDWFDNTLDPETTAYRLQQLRLWQQISGRRSDEYHADELAAEFDELDDVDPLSYYAAGDSAVAGEHLIALGHLVHRSGLRRGSAALEYGAGSGQIALALARLGVTVHTVDMSITSCRAISQLAHHYDMDLTAHNEGFGYAPEGRLFDLIYFYETFHHCLEFQDLIPRLRDLLAPGGRVILAGEPILRDDSPILPYPWGMRMDVESVVGARERDRLELGFQESYLCGRFVRAGFVWERHDCPPSRHAEVLVLSRRQDRIDLANHWLTAAEEMSWHGPESAGRWTRYRSWLNVDQSADSIEVSLANHHPVTRRVTLASGGFTSFDIPARERVQIRIAQSGGQLAIECEPLIPRSYGMGDDQRELGVFVESLTY